MKKENKDFIEKRYLSELSGCGVWRIPGRENRKYKGPEERAGLAFKWQGWDEQCQSGAGESRAEE